MATNGNDIIPMTAVEDINLLKPLVGEKILCDEWGNKVFKVYALSKVTPQTFKARMALTATGEVELQVRFKRCKGSGKHLFYRDENGTLFYRWIR